MNLRTAAEAMRAEATGDARALAGMFDNQIKGFSIDSRTVEAGELFFALSPPDYERHGITGSSLADGHEFISQALAQGALAAVARRDHVVHNEALRAHGEQLLLVDDVIAALQRLAQSILKQWARPVVAITGSAGKTTAKNLTALVLSVAGQRVLRSQKNYNNELGVPLAVLQMESAGARADDYDIAVLEMGMSLPGEIAKLCRLAPPDIAVELLVAPVHLEALGTIEGIAAEKAALIENLKPEGIAVLNADDERVLAMRSLHSGRTITFGIENEADVTADEIESAGFGRSHFLLRTPLGSAPVELSLPGRHSLMNALAAAAVATCCEIEPGTIAAALRQAVPEKMRGEVWDFAAGWSLVDDSYNSNPRSLVSMAQAISEGGAPAARRVVIAGEMLELGPESAALHRETGREIARMKIDVLWGVRGQAEELLQGARAGGMPAEAVRFFATPEEAAAAFLTEARAGDLVLVKGSRGVRTDKIVQLLRDHFPLVGADDRE